MAPCDRHALLVQAGGQAVIVIGSVDVVLDVFLAGPHHLDWTIDLTGDLDRQGDPVEVHAAAKTATKQVIMDLHLIQG